MSDAGPLTGYTIGITAVRRRREFGTALERRGARVVYAPAMATVAPAEDPVLLDATKRCIATPIDVVVATTAVGLRGWLAAAGAWGISDALRDQLASAQLLTRGPKVRAAIRVAGLRVDFSPESESISELIDHLVRMDLTGKRVAVQVHGEPLPDLLAALRHTGADVLEVPVFGWRPPEDPAPLEQLVAAVATDAVDAVAFTSAPASAGFLRAAAESDRAEDVLASLQTRVVTACVGPVTAAPFQAAGVAVVMPAKSRLASLVREIADQVPARRGLVLTAAGHRVEIRGHAAVVDGAVVTPGPASMAVLKALAARPGRVLTRATLLDALPDERDERAVDRAITRLSSMLTDSRIVQDIAGHGYRLAFEPDRAGSCGHEAHP